MPVDENEMKPVGNACFLGSMGSILDLRYSKNQYLGENLLGLLLTQNL